MDLLEQEIDGLVTILKIISNMSMIDVVVVVLPCSLLRRRALDRMLLLCDMVRALQRWGAERRSWRVDVHFFCEKR